MNTCIIPARSGSKRVPNKNLRNFCGKPMISWAIESALSSNLFDEIIVSTDSPLIADVATSLGVNVPGFRPERLADDYSTTREVVQHAIESMVSVTPKYVCCIYATNPLLRSADIAKAYRMLVVENLDFVFSVTPYSPPFQRALQIDAEGIVSSLFPEFANTRTQDIPPMYHDAGQFYWGTTDAFMSHKSVFNSQSKAVVIPHVRCQDIDNEEDWILAEMKFEASMKGQLAE